MSVPPGYYSKSWGCGCRDVDPTLESHIKLGSLDKPEKLINLICKINGREYPQEREVKNFKITIG